MNSRDDMRALFLVPLLAQRRHLHIIAVALVVSSLAQAAFLPLMKLFERALFAPPGSVITAASLLSEETIARFPALADWSLGRASLALYLPLGILAAALVKAVGTYVYQLNQQRVALRMASSYRERLFEAMLELPYTEIKARSPGTWMSIVMNDVLFLQMRFSDIMTGVVKDGMTVLVSFMVLAWLHWPTAAVLAAASPFLALSMGRTGRRIARYSEAFQREIGRLSAAVLDMRARFDFIRAQGGEARELSRFKAMAQAYYEMIRKSILVRAAFAPALELFGFAALAGVVYAIGSGALTVKGGDLFMFLGAFGMIVKPLRGIGEQISRYSETRGALAASLSTFRRLRELGDDASATPSIVRANLPATHRLPSKVTITNMEAGMAGDVRFKGQGIELVAGRTVAVIGPSGAGKSTMIKTLAGLVAPLGWDASIAWSELAQSASMVSQDPFLFDDTIAANLRYGAPVEAVPDDAALWDALAQVNIDDEIRRLPEGLATRLRAIGNNVSGGQLQRLVIARALLRREPLWLLDEATAAIDSRSEKDITLRLITACRSAGAMLIAATHRLQWLEAFDEVWFIEAGELALRGSHTELLKHARYREYCVAGGEG